LNVFVVNYIPTTQYGIIPCKQNSKAALVLENEMISFNFSFNRRKISFFSKKQKEDFNLPAKTSSLKFIVLDALLMPPLVK
jgi:hypothetical protein